MRIKTLIFCFLICFLSVVASNAQPLSGRYFGVLRGLQAEQYAQYQMLGGGASPQNSDFINARLQLQGGKMLSEKYAVGGGLNLGYNEQYFNGVGGNSITVGLNVFGRRWFGLRDNVYAHVDLQAGYSYTNSYVASFYNVNEVSLGLLPGLSWFFHPNWSLEGRMTGIAAQYEDRWNANGDQQRLLLNYNVNPLAMQFAISRFF